MTDTRDGGLLGGDSQIKLQLLQAIALGIGQIVKALGSTGLPAGTTTPTAGSSAGYLNITIGGTAYKVQIYNT